MPLFQPPVAPLPGNFTLADKTIIITGATSGLGLETARQALIHSAATVILAVRNIGKGEACKAQLLADPAAQSGGGVVRVLALDMESYASVRLFVEAVKGVVERVDVLVLNAAVGAMSFARSGATGHEQMMQVNYLSNVLLLVSLLPLLRAAAAGGNAPPGRVTWVGSRALTSASFAGKGSLREGASVLARMDDEAEFYSLARYPDTKLLALLFVERFAARVGSAELVVNMMCPGMVDTDIFDVLPFYFRWPMTVVKAILARTVEQGGWLVLNAAAVVGRESHGKFLLDATVAEPFAFVQSEVGMELGDQLWRETLREIEEYVDLPKEMRGAC